MPWFRLDCGWWLSEWVIPLSSESQLCWIRLIEYAKEKGSKGEVKAVSPSVAARIWMVGDESVRKMLEAAQNSGAIEIVDGHWKITAWDQYQPDPTAAERQANARAKRTQKSSPSRSVTVTHGDIRESRLQDNTIQDKTRQDKTTTGAVVDLIDVVEFAAEIGKSQTEAAKFFDQMEQDGWNVAGEAVRNWKGLFRSWSPPLRVEHGGKSPGAITVEEAERIREGGPTPGSESPFAKLKRELAEKAAQGGDSA